jgi:hypothetical protein
MPFKVLADFARHSFFMVVKMSKDAFDIWYEGAAFPIGISKIEYAIEAWNHQKGIIDALTAERDALREQLAWREAVVISEKVKKAIAFAKNGDSWRDVLDSYDVAELLINLDSALNQPAKPCEYCDGTGDVHSFDGEWRGECTACDASKANMELDARRYQWIRVSSDAAQEIFDKYAGEMLDSEIDKAIQAAQQGATHAE